MKLDNVLASKAVNTSSSSHAVVHLNGSIEPDHDQEYFRLYREPHNPRAYLLIRKSDVRGDLHEWTPDELASAGHIGAKVFRVPMAHSAQVQAVTVKIHRLGETISGQVSSGQKTATGDCHYAGGGCSPEPCCTTGSDGECYCDSCCVA